MLNKFNCFDIIISHTNTLKDFNQNKISIREVLFFYCFPLFGGIVGALFITPNLERIEPVVVSIYAIFAPLLLNLLLFNMAELRKNNSDDLYKEFLREIHHNVSFSILIAVLGIMSAMIDLLIQKYTILSINIKKVSLVITTDDMFFFLLIYFGTLFSLSLFMILKRFHVLQKDTIQI